MKFEISNRFSGDVIFSLETESLRFCLQAAVKQGADLQGAYLRGADLQGAYLQGAYLKGAYLQGADLKGADLQGADLMGAYLQGADLQGADLQGDLKHADPEQAVANLDKVREIILDQPNRLYMGHWHGSENWINHTCAEETLCGTTHCLAGWLQTCSTEEEIRRLDNTFLAGVLSAPVAAKMFYRENSEVMDWLKARKYAEAAA